MSLTYLWTFLLLLWGLDKLSVELSSSFSPAPLPVFATLSSPPS
ncbi:hypothetical protein [Candidatus Ichthyocystis hellenicum]|nr:hypothetical protein [Candidatus Ichthyocystis hellenicum]